jgi:hypothetical protein
MTSPFENPLFFDIIWTTIYDCRSDTVYFPPKDKLFMATERVALCRTRKVDFAQRYAALK